MTEALKTTPGTEADAPVVPKRRRGLSVPKRFLAGAAAVGLAFSAATAGAMALVHRGGEARPGANTPGITESYKPTPKKSDIVVVPPSGDPTESPASPSIEPPPTEAPTPFVTGFVKEPDGEIVWKEQDKVTGREIDLKVPDIDGLEAEIQGGKEVYIAEKGNAYGLKEKAYGGEFNPYVSK